MIQYDTQFPNETGKTKLRKVNFQQDLENARYGRFWKMPGIDLQKPSSVNI